MSKSHTIEGGDQVKLHVHEAGKADGPAIVFIHGWSGSQAFWNLQKQSPLADEFRLVCLDLRGHGMSEKPAAQEQYTDGKLWAEDVHAVIKALELDKPVLLGWSYGGLLVLDYVRHYGQTGLSGLALVGPAIELSPDAFGPLIGPGFLNHAEGATVDNLQSNIDTLRSFAHTMAVKSVDRAYFEEAICWSVIVPHTVRGSLVAREVRNDDLLSEINLPVLVIQGQADTCAMPAVAERIDALCSSAKVAWYPGVGHMPFAEEPERFNADLAEFVRAAAQSS
ncbi:MAG: alpha/beta hydrolase [Haliangiales bacterium]